jgi:hypothetical protein
MDPLADSYHLAIGWGKRQVRLSEPMEKEACRRVACSNSNKAWVVVRNVCVE